MRLDCISKHRTLLMGVAILWIMFFHSWLDLEENSFLHFLKRFGYGGVDIFIFLSGFGIYFALNKSSSSIDFFRCRLWRIVPYYYPIMLFFSFLFFFYNIWSIQIVVENIFMIGFWANRGLDNMFDWYIPALLFLYLITPVFNVFFKKNQLLATLGIIFLFVIFNYTIGLRLDYLYSLTFRAPLYFFGFWLADFYVNHRDFRFDRWGSLALGILFVIGIGLSYWLYYYTNVFNLFGLFLVPFWLITFPLCVFLSNFFSLFGTYKFPVLSFFGTYSLMFYLFHERNLIVFYSLDVEYFNLVAFLVTIVDAVLFYKLITWIVSRIRHKKVITTTSIRLSNIENKR